MTTKKKRDRAAAELNLWGEPFEEKGRPDEPSLLLDDWGKRTIRRLMIRGEPWWVLADVARVLDYRDAANAGRLLRDKHKGTHLVSTPGGGQEMTVINEAGLYRLMMRSDHPGAEAFQDWITDEVLPSIRRTGSYSSHDGRIARMTRRLGTDDPATLMARFDQLDLNKRLNRWMSERGFKPCHFRAFHNAAYESMTGRDAPELRGELGLKPYQTPLDRMGDVALSLHAAIKHTAFRLIRDTEADAGRELTAEEQRELFDRASDAVLGQYLARLGFEYSFGLRSDTQRGPVLDLIRRQIGQPGGDG